MKKKILLVSAVLTLLITADITAQVKKDNTPPNRDQTTKSYSKEATPVRSRISIEQLSRNLTKAFKEKFPTNAVDYDRSVIFDFMIEPDGTASYIEVVRSDFDKEMEVHLIQLIDKVTMNAWEPASLKGKKIPMQYTLKLYVMKGN
ncbi:hypothetical protein HMPREF9711_02037 [Myroides odoratimimus CCUG 3837]|uniref:hypothetical protein n=1 Tax=Myroides odoratimimus TaxID=76832 RepID=UPI000280ACB9|nr:hypothetical protein [Myroides odoratimimus]EKB04106.1 hypothetical protein HMPREF9711_02037 [Myroides odoratimimus CCUG 3837]